MNNIIKQFKAFCVLMLTLLPLRAEIPIVAFGSIPIEQSTAKRFDEFREAGFDISIHPFWGSSVNDILRVLDEAQKSGVRLLVGSNLLYSDYWKLISAIKNHPALYGYYLRDEPMQSDIDVLSRVHNNIRAADQSHICYLNLLPNYGLSTSYEQYLRLASEMSLSVISFDHYPITTSGIRTTWYENLELIRQESKRTNTPFWAFVLSTPHYHYPQPTLASLRLQIYSNLAYGARAIQYFTYWTPEPYDRYDFHDGPIDNAGNRTRNYDLVRNMNLELRKILPLFDKAKISSVYHIGDIPYGTKRIKRTPANIRKIKIAGALGAIVSTMNTIDYTYMVLVNKDLNNTLRVDMSFRKGVVEITKDLTERDVKDVYYVSPGDLLIFRLA